MKTYRKFSLIFVQTFLLFSTIIFGQWPSITNQQTSCPQPNNLNTRLYGLTIDKVSEKHSDDDRRLKEAIIEQLQFIRASNPSAPMPIVRVVLDVESAGKTDTVMSDYVTITKAIHDQHLAYVMAELLDSHDMRFCVKKGPEKDADCFLNRTKNYLTALDNYVDIWEVGNEINGKWAGGDDNELDGNDQFSNKKQAARKNARESVLRQVKAAYDFLEGKNKRTAITFYFNDDGERTSLSNIKDDPQYSMMKWLKDYKDMFPQVDYVFISFYSDDNFAYDPQLNAATPIKPSNEKWASIFKTVKDYYPCAQVGFGEVGAQCNYKKDGSPRCNVLEDANQSECKDRKCDCCLKAQRDYIREYYQDRDEGIRSALKKNYSDFYEQAFVGGYFYWHFNPDVINKIAKAKKEKNPKKKEEIERPAIVTRQALLDAYKTWR